MNTFSNNVKSAFPVHLMRQPLSVHFSRYISILTTRLKGFVKTLTSSKSSNSGVNRNIISVDLAFSFIEILVWSIMNKNRHKSVWGHIVFLFGRIAPRKVKHPTMTQKLEIKATCFWQLKLSRGKPESAWTLDMVNLLWEYGKPPAVFTGNYLIKRILQSHVSF